MRIILDTLLALVMLTANARGEGKFPWDRVAGVDVSDFRVEFVSEVEANLGKIRCYGRCTDSVVDCLRRDPPHATASRLARDVFQLMAQGKSPQEVEKYVKARQHMAHPEWTSSFDLEEMVPLGKKDAAVVIVEFSDFQCPFCAKIAPILDQVVQESNGRARLYFKQFPIKGRVRALEAAKASVAAGAFGKFWEYVRLLYENSKDLSDENLLRLAEKIGIDRAKFAVEIKRDEVLSKIADEKMEGLRARIQGTPTLFINGKEMILVPTRELLLDRIQEELDILEGRD